MSVPPADPRPESSDSTETPQPPGALGRPESWVPIEDAATVFVDASSEPVVDSTPDPQLGAAAAGWGVDPADFQAGDGPGPDAAAGAAGAAAAAGAAGAAAGMGRAKRRWRERAAGARRGFAGPGKGSRWRALARPLRGRRGQLIAALLMGLLLGVGGTALFAGGFDHHGDRPGHTGTSNESVQDPRVHPGGNQHQQNQNQQNQNQNQQNQNEQNQNQNQQDQDQDQDQQQVPQGGR